MRNRTKSNIFVAGHAVIDEIIDSPSQGEPRFEPGGALCYSSLCLKSLGYDTEIVTRIGMDFPREYSKILLTEAGVDIEEWRVNDFPTTRYRIDRSDNERKLWLLAKCRDLSFRDFARAFDDATKSLPKLLILNPVAGEVSLQLLKRISKEFDQVFVDSQGFTRRFDEKTGQVSMKSGLDISTLAGVDVLKADSDELCAWTGTESKKAAIEQISTFVKNIVITSGRGEVELYMQGMLSVRARPYEVDVKDSTGAGDIMLSTLAARLLETNNMLEALEFATAASSLSLERIGLRKAIISREKISQRVRKSPVT